MVSANSMVKVDYTASTNGRVFDTTDEKVAKQNNVFVKEGRYVPVVLSVGKGQTIKGFDEALADATVGKPSTVLIPAEKGYGPRNSDLIRLVPLAKFQQQGIDPKPGMLFELDGMPSRVQSVSGGRVRVDFNHALAGLELKYEFTVRAELKTALEKVSSLTDEYLGLDAKHCSYDAATKTATISVPSDKCMARDYMGTKARLISIIMTYLEDVENVKIIEEFSKKSMGGEKSGGE